MPNLKLTRDQLAAFLPDHQSIRAFEQMLNDVATTLPDTVEEANNNANIAVAAANAAISAFVDLASQVSTLLCAPPEAEIVETDDYSPRFVLVPENDDLLPRFEIGTIASQNADNIEITGGTISGITLTGSSGSFTTISASGQITSMVSTGTAPLVIASTTKVANLNADLLDGTDWSAPGTIGGTTPGAASFTTINSSGQITSTVSTGTAPLVIASTTKVANLNVDQLDGADWAAPAAIGSTTPNTATLTTLKIKGTSTLANAEMFMNATDTDSNIFASSSSGVPKTLSFFGSGGGTATLSLTGSAVTIRANTSTTAGVSMTIGGAFGCNTKSAQTAFASGGAVSATAATNVSPWGYTTQAQADAIVTLVNNIRTALVNNGIMS